MCCNYQFLYFIFTTKQLILYCYRKEKMDVDKLAWAEMVKHFSWQLLSFSSLTKNTNQICKVKLLYH